MLQHVSRSKLVFEHLEDRRLLAADISLIRHFDTWDAGIIRSTDVAGVAYHAPSGQLYLADSEINEIPSIFDGDNIFVTSTRGDRIVREIRSNNGEPTGITYNEADGYFYVTNDVKKTLTRYSTRLDQALRTIKIRNDVPNASDPEGVTSDPSTGRIYVVDGAAGGRQVLVYDRNLAFQGRFSISRFVDDAEGIAFNPANQHLYIVTSDLSIIEVTTRGDFVESYDISHFTPRPDEPQGLTFAPTSDRNDPAGALALYIADPMRDNHPDGRIFETRLSSDPSVDNVVDDNVVDDVDDPAPVVSNANGTLDLRVSSSSDDAEEEPSGDVSLTSSDLELVHDDDGNQTVGMRFTDVNLPQGAVISRAYLQFQADETSTGAGRLQVRGEATDNASTFSTRSHNLSSRPTTRAAVAWSPPSWTKGAASANQRSPDLSDIVQEIAQRPGWSPGNSLVLLVTGNGERTAESFDGKQHGAPLLHIEYSTERVTAGPPVLSPIPNQTVSEGATLVFRATGTTNNGSSAGLSYSLDEAAPEGAQIDSSTGLFTWTPRLGQSGTYSFNVRLADNRTPQLNDVERVRITVHASRQGIATIEQRVSASSDDAEEKQSGSIDLNSTDLEFVVDRTIRQTIGIRFASLDIPQGASIIDAHIQFQVDEPSSGLTSIVLRGESADNSAAFRDSDFNISSRRTTNASTSWSIPSWNIVGESGSTQTTPNVAGIVQEIVNRPSWRPGNAFSFLITGSGARWAESFDGDPSGAPQLRVRFRTSGVNNAVAAHTRPVAFVLDAAERIHAEETESTRQIDATVDWLAAYRIHRRERHTLSPMLNPWHSVDRTTGDHLQDRKSNHALPINEASQHLNAAIIDVAIVSIRGEDLTKSGTSDAVSSDVSELLERSKS